MTLKDLPIGKCGVITKVGGSGQLRQHFLDMGLIPGVEVNMIKHAPLGDPVLLFLHGYELSLRKEDASKIEIDSVQEKNKKIPIKENNVRNRTIHHPGLGEDGRYHEDKNAQPISENEQLTFALVGNQNCGKTTLFNALTGSSQHVGNFPGVTVDRKDGVIKNYSNTLVTDLPGIYSMSPYTSEEIVTREFILKQKPKCIINIVDATNIERNLYLTMQLLELNIPMVIALNMMDEMRQNHGVVRVNEMEEMLGVPVIPISASKNEGIDELVEHAIHIAMYQERPSRQDYCDANDHNGAVHRCLHAITHLIEDHAKDADIPIRFAASKLASKDELILNALKLDDNELDMLEHIIKQMEKERELDYQAAIADMRFAFINKVCNQTVVKPTESKEHELSMKIDKVLTGKYTAIPMFIGIMGLVFYLTFNVIGAWLSSGMEVGVNLIIDLVAKIFETSNVNIVLKSLVIDGILGGIGSVISFLPIIVTLFFFLSILEDSGYMARVAFVMDKLLRKIGLSGRSIVPMLVGFGCTVPGVMASRTLPSKRDRKLTIILTPFMSCSAKLPIYAFFVSVFFPGKGAVVMVSLYFIGILAAIVVALILNKTKFKGKAVPFVMELPNYRMPAAKNVVQLLWEKAKDFLQKAFTIIFISTMVIWFLQKFDLNFNMVENSSESILATIAGFIAPIFKPLGFGDWRISTALITGFMAKESVVSTLMVLYGTMDKIRTVFTPVCAFSFLVFCLLYTPCIAAIASIKRELGTKWAVSIAVFQCSIAWICAFITSVLGQIIKNI